MHSVMIKLNKQYKKSRTQKKGWFIILWTNYSLKNKNIPTVKIVIICQISWIVEVKEIEV